MEFFVLRLVCFMCFGWFVATARLQAVEEGLYKQNTATAQVALLQFAGHGISQAIEQGFKDGFAKTQSRDLKLHTYTAKGKLENTKTLAQLLSAKELDLILTIGPTATQTAILATNFKRECPETKTHVPIIFTAVNDPFSVNILSKKDAREGIYGVVAPKNTKAQIELMQTLLPCMERIGVVHSADEVSTLQAVEDLKEIAAVFNIQVCTVAVTELQEVATAYLELRDTVDAFFMPLDQRLLVQVELIVALAGQVGVPVFASDSVSVQKGALAALGYDYYEAGLMAADVALRLVIDPKQAAQQPLIEQKQRLTLNRKTARSLRIVFPASVLNQADRIVD